MARVFVAAQERCRPAQASILKCAGDCISIIRPLFNGAYAGWLNQIDRAGVENHIPQYFGKRYRFVGDRFPKAILEDDCCHALARQLRRRIYDFLMDRAQRTENPYGSATPTSNLQFKVFPVVAPARNNAGFCFCFNEEKPTVSFKKCVELFVVRALDDRRAVRPRVHFAQQLLKLISTTEGVLLDTEQNDLTVDIRVGRHRQRRTKGKV